MGFRSSDPLDAAGTPLAESAWVESFPDALLVAGSPNADPEEIYELRESVELALVAALQHLPPNQRAALLLVDVLGFPAAEAAETLGTSLASFNSALQRARRLLDEHRPAITQQATLRSMGGKKVDRVVDRHVRAMKAADVDGVIGMLCADATWSMPPEPAWFAGPSAIASFLRENRFRYFGWRYLRVTANGHPPLRPTPSTRRAARTCRMRSTFWTFVTGASRG